MLTPTNTNLVPRGGWSVEIEGAGPPIVANHFSLFVKEIGKRLIANGLDKHGWREEALDLMCRQRPDIPCEDKEVQARAVTGDDVKRFVKTLYEAWEQGAKPVSIEEQERRAAICMECPMRGTVSCMGGCGALARALSDLTMGGSARNLPELHKQSCLICGCELSSLTMYPMEVLRAVDEKINFKTTEYPPNCWKLTAA